MAWHASMFTQTLSKHLHFADFARLSNDNWQYSPGINKIFFFFLITLFVPRVYLQNVKSSVLERKNDKEILKKPSSQLLCRTPLNDNLKCFPKAQKPIPFFFAHQTKFVLCCLSHRNWLLIIQHHWFQISLLLFTNHSTCLITILLMKETNPFPWLHSQTCWANTSELSPASDWCTLSKLWVRDVNLPKKV